MYSGAPLVRVRQVRPNPSIFGEGFLNLSIFEGERLNDIRANDNLHKKRYAAVGNEFEVKIPSK